MKTTKLHIDSEECYSVNLTYNYSPFSVDYSVTDNKLETDAGHWYSGYKVKSYDLGPN